MSEKASPNQEKHKRGDAMSNAYFTPDHSRATARELLERIVGPLKYRPSIAIAEASRKTKLAYGTVKALWYKERRTVPWDLIKNLELAVERFEAKEARLSEQTHQIARLVLQGDCDVENTQKMDVPATRETRSVGEPGPSDKAD